MENNQKMSKLKKYLNCIKKGWLIVFIFAIIGALLGLIIANRTFTKPYLEKNYVTLNFKYTSDLDIDYEKIISKENIARCKKITKSLETGSKISTYKYVELTDVKIINHDNYHTIYADMNSFNVSQDGTYNDSAAKGFLKHLTILQLITDEEITEFSKIEEKVGHPVFDNFDKEFYTSNSLDSDGKIKILYSDLNAVKYNHEAEVKSYTIWITSFTLGLTLISLVFIYFYIDKYNNTLEKEYDNDEIYRTPFHISYFKKSLSAFTNVKSLVSIALLLALVMISKFLWIPSGFSDLGIGFGYLFLAIACMMYGPVPSLLIGILSDVIGYLVKPDGAFFIGYTFQAMLACFTYGMLFYKTHITFSRVLLARVIVNLICNVVIGSLCRAFIYSLNYNAFMTYMLTISLPKNLVYLLPQSLLLFFVLKAVTVPMSAMNLINPAIAENISFF